MPTTLEYVIVCAAVRPSQPRPSRMQAEPPPRLGGKHHANRQHAQPPHCTSLNRSMCLLIRIFPVSSASTGNSLQNWCIFHGSFEFGFASFDYPLTLAWLCVCCVGALLPVLIAPLQKPSNTIWFLLNQMLFCIIIDIYGIGAAFHQFQSTSPIFTLIEPAPATVNVWNFHHYAHETHVFCARSKRTEKKPDMQRKRMFMKSEWNEEHTMGEKSAVQRVEAGRRGCRAWSRDNSKWMSSDNENAANMKILLQNQ